MTEILGHTSPPGDGPGCFLPMDDAGIRGFFRAHPAEWAESAREKMGLQSLYARAGEPGVEIIRLLVMPWRGGGDYAIEIEVDPDNVADHPANASRQEVDGDAEASPYRAFEAGGTLRYVVSGSEFGPVIAARGEAVVIVTVIETIRQYLDAADLLHERCEDPFDGLDGSEWVLEVLRGGRYHAVRRWEPGVFVRSAGTVAFATLCKYIREAVLPYPIQGPMHFSRYR